MPSLTSLVQAVADAQRRRNDSHTRSFFATAAAQRLTAALTDPQAAATLGYVGSAAYNRLAADAAKAWAEAFGAHETLRSEEARLRSAEAAVPAESVELARRHRPNAPSAITALAELLASGEIVDADAAVAGKS